MRKTENRRKKVQMPAGIRQKMMAAVSMLMVSCIMLVSSTYAWFTLSTAPEVTGITTNVGANGNLEMLLLTGYIDETTNTQAGSFYSEDEDLGVVSEVGDSMAVADKPVTESNVKWGNLVDLSDASYGLDNIILSPARMPLTALTGTEGTTYQANTSSLLNVPSYGTDGRVITVDTSVYTGKWNSEDNEFTFDDAHKGVRALGTTTDVSQQLAAYRTAKTDMQTGITVARSEATTSLYANGQDLANMMVAYMNNEKVQYTAENLATLDAVLDSLDNATKGMADAMKNAVLAYTLSQAVDTDGVGTLADEDVSKLKGALLTDISSVYGTGTYITSTDVFTTAAIEKGVTAQIPSGLDTAVSSYKALCDKISAAKTKLASINAPCGYNDISPVLNQILNKAYVVIAGEQDPGKDQIGDIAAEVGSKGSVTITMLSGSGVYADIAELVNNYSVNNLQITVNFQGTDIGAKANMVTAVTVGPYVDNLSTGTAPGSSMSSTTGAAISDTYGYALDFGFRTNAATSDLQLQTAAVNRVYSDQTDTALNTQGSGSYMQFTSADITTFTPQDVLNLMSAIRVAFIEAESGDLLALGALDITRTTDETTAITTYSAGDTTEEISGGYKTGLFLYDYSVNDETKALILGDQKTDKSAITALTQNVASKITVLVYLDGDIVDNTMVANATQSLSGKMNIQFSSSATLAPMENSTMRSGGLGTPGADAVTIDPSTDLVADEGDTYEYKGYEGTVRPGYYIYQPSGSSDLYFTTDPNALTVIYTKLTVANATDVLKITIPEEENQDNGAEMTLSSSALSLTVGGDTATLTVNGAPEGATITWASADANIASVDASTGVVTPVAAGGPVNITATVNGTTTLTCAVTVNAAGN